MFPILDPQGDVVLLLFGPKSDFAAWDESLGQHHTSVVAQQEWKKKKKKKKKRMCKPDFYELDLSSGDIPGPVTQDDVAECTETLQTPQISESTSTGHPYRSIQILTAQEAEEPELRLQVSSRHLMLASAHFNRMFSNKWKEVTSCTIKAEGWDSEIFLVLMNIIHGRTRQVPRSVSLESLAKLAVLVDYYDCLEVVEVYSDNWIKKLENYLPNNYGRDLVLWIVVSLVFRQPELFRRVTAITIDHIPGRLQTLGLPIPQHLTDAIDTKRQTALEFAIISLHDLLSKFTGDEDSCSFECSSFLLGALTKEIDRRQLFSPETLRSASLARVTETLQEIESQELYQFYHSRRGCNFQTHIEPIIADLRQYSEGLALENLVPLERSETPGSSKGGEA